MVNCLFKNAGGIQRGVETAGTNQPGFRSVRVGGASGGGSVLSDANRLTFSEQGYLLLDTSKGVHMAAQFRPSDNSNVPRTLLLGAACLFWVSGCYPTVPSSTCADRISNCLGSCENESPEQQELNETSNPGRVTASPCEQRCHAQCGNSLVPQTATSSGQSTTPTIGATPTGATATAPTPEPPPIEPPSAPTTTPNTEETGTDNPSPQLD